MKLTKHCPKCKSFDIIRVNGVCGAYGSGNNIQTGMTIFSAVPVNRYISSACGYAEKWIDPHDVEKLRESSKALIPK